MHRILLLFSLLTLLAAVIVRKLNGDRVLYGLREIKLNMTAEDLAYKMLSSMSENDVEVKTPTRLLVATSDLGPQWLTLPIATASGVSANSHGLAALKVGLYLLSLRNPKLIARRRWAVRFGHVFPIFTTMVVIFALIVTRFGGLWGFAVILASCGLAACAQLLSLTAERQAAELAIVVLEKKRILPRLSDEEAVVSATRAHAWRSVIPGVLARLVP